MADGTMRSPSEDARLEELWGDGMSGMSDAAISAEIPGRTHNAVRNRRCKLGLVVRNTKRDKSASALTDDELIAELRNRGYAITRAEACSGVMFL